MQRTSAPNIGEAPLPQHARGYGKTRLSALLEGLERLFEAERAQLPPWFVVGFASGSLGKSPWVDSVADRVGAHPWAEAQPQYRRIKPASRP